MANELKNSSEGLLIVITGPSGAGKDRVVGELLKADSNIVRMVTTTSRPMRKGEVEGYDYYFINREKFEEKIKRGDFLEWIEYKNEYYGTTFKELDMQLSTGKKVIWRIDVNGAIRIKEVISRMFPKSVFIFITVENLDVLSQRMIKREVPDKHSLEWRLKRAREEMNNTKFFEHVVINRDGEVDQTVKEIKLVIEKY